ncbi:MAG: pyrophosphohydrolase, partial [Pseudomonadota bacterium]
DSQEGAAVNPPNQEASLTVQFGFVQTQIRMELPPGGSFDPDPQNSLEKPSTDGP